MRIVVRLLLAWFAYFRLTLGLWQWLFPAFLHPGFPGLGRHVSILPNPPTRCCSP